MVDENKPLTPKIKRFCDEYLVDSNATKAAKRAGYAEKSAHVQAHDLLKKPNVIKYIEERQRAIAEKLEITQEMVIAEYAKLAFSNIGNYLSYNDSGVNLVPSDDIKPEHLSCISEVSQTVTESGGTVKFKMHDKKGALDSLSRHLGIFNDKAEVAQTINVLIKNYE